jgi:putative hydrolase of the HAD superfamily
VRIAAEGSDRGGIIDRGLEAVGAADVDVHSLVQAFQAHRPDTLPLLPGVRDMLEQLGSSGVPVALVTDGVESTQESKVAALGLEPLVDHIVMSDRFGRQFRKPHPRPVLEALSRLGCEPDTVVMIGDRPDKDVAAAAAAGVRAIRVRTGEYAQAHDHPFTWRTAADVVAAVAALRDDGFL